MNPINLELLRTFSITAELGSISKASETLFTTQPAVSRSIRRLELQVGYPLFFRTARGVALTHEGTILYKHATQIYNHVATAEKEIQDLHNLLDGEIRIGISATLCKYYLIHYLNQFNHKYPGIHIRITNPTTPEIIDLMKKEQIDIGIINLPLADNDLITKELLALEDCFVVGEKFKALASESPVALARLIDYPILLLEKKSNTRKHIDHYLKDNGLVFEPEMELGNLDLLVQFAVAGRGIAFVTKNFIKHELENDNLFEVKIKEGLPQRFISVSYLKNSLLSPAAEKFLEMLGN